MPAPLNTHTRVLVRRHVQKPPRLGAATVDVLMSEDGISRVSPKTGLGVGIPFGLQGRQAQRHTDECEYKKQLLHTSTLPTQSIIRHLMKH